MQVLAGLAAPEPAASKIRAVRDRLAKPSSWRRRTRKKATQLFRKISYLFLRTRLAKFFGTGFFLNQFVAIIRPLAARDWAMTSEKQPVTIKKYANRRLYNTGASAYVTLDDLAEMVKAGNDFVVFDAKSGEDITRSVLGQIIFEQEGKTGQNLLPIRFLRQLIRYYGDSMQMLVPSYLEFSIERLASDSQKFREQFDAAMSANPLANPLANPTRQMFQTMEEQARKNMVMFREALDMFSPFAANTAETAKPSAADELSEMRAQLAEMKKRIDSLTRKD
jgi:polyhydroxyalkanoate synthesis repressor PhaR